MKSSLYIFGMYIKGKVTLNFQSNANEEQDREEMLSIACMPSQPHNGCEGEYNFSIQLFK